MYAHKRLIELFYSTSDLKGLYHCLTKLIKFNRHGKSYI